VQENQPLDGKKKKDKNFNHRKRNSMAQQINKTKLKSFSKTRNHPAFKSPKKKSL